MTLNITVVSQHGIFQSADFRLAAFEQSADGKWKTLVDNSPKIVTVSDESWEGFITYCGIGMWAYKSTYQFLADWLCSNEQRSLPFDQVSEIVAREGSIWLASIEKNLGRFQGHTFVVAGFEHGVPRVELISNYESTKGKFSRVTGGRLVRSSILSADKTHVIVTGIDNAVSKHQRQLLKQLAHKNHEHNVVRHYLAKVNAQASMSANANNGISESCLCYSLNRSGAGSGELKGAVAKGKFMPISILRGQNMTNKLAELVGPNAQIVQMSLVSSKSTAIADSEIIGCLPAIIVPHEALKSQAEFLSGIDINKGTLELRCANSSGVLVGQFRPRGRPSQAVILRRGDSLQSLGTLGGVTSNASAINVTGAVVGGAQRADHQTRAFLWKPRTGMIDLGTFEDRASAATAMNDREEIVGSCTLTRAMPGVPTERAFIWSEESGMQKIPSLDDDCWSRAIGISANGTVLGWCHRPNALRRSFVWSADAGLQELAGPNGEEFFANAINDSGYVVGEYKDENGDRRAISWTAKNGVEILDVPPNFHPCGLDQEGNIILRDRSSPWRRPWFFSALKVFSPLPYVEAHHTQALAICERLIIGEARQESINHVHPMLWSLGST